MVDGGVNRTPSRRSRHRRDLTNGDFSYIIKNGTTGNIQKAPPLLICSRKLLRSGRDKGSSSSQGKLQFSSVPMCRRCVIVPYPYRFFWQPSALGAVTERFGWSRKKRGSAAFHLLEFTVKNPSSPQLSYTMFSSRFIRPAASTFARATPRPIITNTPSIASRFFTTSSPKMTVHNIAT